MNYDPEGYIHSCKKKKNLSGYTHVPRLGEVVFKNKEDKEADEVIENFMKELDQKKKRLQEMDGSFEEESVGENEAQSQ